MEGCDLSEEEMHALMQEIKGLALNEKIHEVEELLDVIPLVLLKKHPTWHMATDYHGLRI